MDRSEAITLVQFNAWANRRVFARAARLPPRALKASTSLSLRTAIATLVHILDTQWYWREGAQLGDLPVDTLRPSSFDTLHALRRRWDEEDHALMAFIGGLTSRQLTLPVTYAWPRARPRSRPLWHILLHIVNHSTQHRSELAMFLTTKNLSPGNLDFLRFAARATRART
jgi:uncharacterized damage-inducible protein DinB